MAESGANTLDLIQPHSVSADEVASYYGTAMDQASILVREFFVLFQLFAGCLLVERYENNACAVQSQAARGTPRLCIAATFPSIAGQNSAVI